MATQTQIDALKDAYYQGATRVTYNNRTIEYRSRAEMAAIISEMEDELSAKTDADKVYSPTFDRAY